MSTLRTLSPLDRLLDSAQNALSTLAGSPRAERANPGDDTPDVPMLERAILAVAVADAHATARAAAHWTTPAAGGHGAVREVCDLLLTAHGT